MNRCAAGSPPGLSGASAGPVGAGAASRPTFGAAWARRSRDRNSSATRRGAAWPRSAATLAGSF